MSFDDLKSAFDDAGAPDPYEAFRATAEQCAAQTGYQSSPPSSIQAFAQKATPSGPVATLAASAASGPESSNTKPGQAVQNDKVRAALATPVQQANKPGGDMGTSVRTTEKLVEQGRQFQEAKAAVTGQEPAASMPQQKDILGNNVSGPSFSGPKLVTTLGAFTSAVSGPRTPEQTIVMGNAYKENLAKGFGEGKRARGSYDYLSSGPSRDQQERMASVGGGSIQVDPDLAFRARNTGDSLAGINGVKLDKGDPTIKALNEKGQRLSEQMETQRSALAIPVTTQGWDGVTEAQAAGLNVGPDNLTMKALVPERQLAQLERFDARSLTIS